jgi:RES domain-containing protein
VTVDRSLAVRVAAAGTGDVAGSFQRHVSPKVRTLTGTAAGGRWGYPGTYRVLYLARPRDSVVVEAYRHLVDDIEGMTGDLVGPRRLLTCNVSVTNVLDLRAAAARDAVGVTMEELMGPWEPCQRIGQAAHQLGLHGVIAPAPTHLGETLALFELHLPADELPELVRDDLWPHLPPDPRLLRVVAGEQ